MCENDTLLGEGIHYRPIFCNEDQLTEFNEMWRRTIRLNTDCAMFNIGFGLSVNHNGLSPQIHY